MGSSLNGTGVTFSNGSTQSVAWPGNTGTVTSITAGNGLTGGTITGSGTIALDFYTGTTVNNTSYPIGSHIITNGYNFGDSAYRDVNASFTVWSPSTGVGTIGRTAFNLISSSGTGSAALAGTWRSRGACPSPSSCNLYMNLLMQRTA